MYKNMFSKYQANFDENMKRSIIEAAVSVYGEACRSMIEERIGKIVIIQYITPDDIKSEMKRLLREKTDELTLKFLRDFGFEVPENINDLDGKMKHILNVIFGRFKFSDMDFCPIFSFNKDKNNTRNLRERCEVLNGFCVEGVTPENYEEFENSDVGKLELEKIKGVLQIVNELVMEFNLYKEQFKDEERYMSEYGKFEKKLNMEAIRSYLDELKDFVPLEDKEKIEEALALPEDAQPYELTDILGDNYIRFGDIQLMANIEAFDGEELNYEREGRMVSYFKSCGLDLGYDYSSYIDSEEAKKLIPPIELVKKVKELRQKYGNEVRRELFLKSGTIPFDIEKIESLGLIGDSEFSMELVETGVTAVVPNVRVNGEGKVENVNLMFIPPLKGLKEYKECKFIHEVLHCLEGSMKEVNGEYVFCTGFEKIDIELSNDDVNIDKKVNREVRKYEKFSENIHQKLTMDVYKQLILSGINIFANLEEQKVKGGTEYEHYNFVTNEFYSKFKKQIAYARMTGNLDRLMELIGKENFEKLNDLVTEYSDIPWYSMMDDVISNRETLFTLQRAEIGEAAHSIVLDMEHTRDAQDRT